MHNSLTDGLVPTLDEVDHSPIAWDQLRPFEQQQGGYWLYGPWCDAYGNGKIWVPVYRPGGPWPLEKVLTEYRDGDEHGWATEFAHLREIHLAKLFDLAGDIAQHGIKEPILLGTDGRVWDGHHRLCVAQHLGIRHVPIALA